MTVPTGFSATCCSPKPRTHGTRRHVCATRVVATANPFCDLPWVRRGRMSFKAEILPKAHDEKNARRGYPLSLIRHRLALKIA